MKILFGVFDWGLGHATRSIPLIDSLLSRSHEVHVVSTGNALSLLKQHYKNKCKFYDVPSLHSVYNYKRFFKTNFAISIPKILLSLKRAREISKMIIQKNSYDVVISDCRYDVYDRPHNSFLINHQLRFAAPPLAREILELFLKEAMERYKLVIVPDYARNGLTGELSHKLCFVQKEKIKYIGILSRIKKRRTKQDIDYFISLSGPEKTRNALMGKLVEQAQRLEGKVVMAGGEIGKGKKVQRYKNLTLYRFVDGKKQEELMNRAKFLIVRAGYTTIMEIAELGKKALLIPSPGQTEQEYLARHCASKKMFHYANQNSLDLIKEIKIAKKFRGARVPWKTSSSVKKFCEIVLSLKRVKPVNKANACISNEERAEDIYGIMAMH